MNFGILLKDKARLIILKTKVLAHYEHMNRIPTRNDERVRRIIAELHLLSMHIQDIINGKVNFYDCEKNNVGKKMKEINELTWLNAIKSSR